MVKPVMEDHKKVYNNDIVINLLGKSHSSVPEDYPRLSLAQRCGGGAGYIICYSVPKPF